MAMERQFLGWDRPCLAAAAQRLIEAFASPAATDAVDLRDVVIVLPGSRAGRRLMELLIDAADERQRRLVPPRMLTTGSMLDELLQHPAPLADGLARRLAWIDALSSAPPAELEAVIPRPPAADDRLAWASLADTLEAMHVELAGEAMGFADVAAACETILDFSFKDTQRWAALELMQRAYLARLGEAGLLDPQTARREAIDAGRLEPFDRLVLIAAADLNKLQRRFLARVGDRATALIHAPQMLADRFDEYGCLLVEAWGSLAAGVRDEQVHVVGGPSDQAAEVIRQLAGLSGAFAADQITLGVCDEQVTPFLRQGLPEFGLPVRDAGGTALRRTPLMLMFGAMADWLESRRFADLAKLLRHPDVESAVRRRLGEDPADSEAIEHWLELMDRYHREHLQGQITMWLGDAKTAAPLKRVHDAVVAIAGELGGGAARPLQQWTQPIVMLLLAVYGGTGLRRNEHRDRLVIEAADMVHERLVGMAQLPEALAPSVCAAEAMRLLMHDLQGQSVPADVRDAAIELLGPLELQLDDAPVLMLTGFNDGAMPSSVNADAFLPDAVRTRLGIVHNQRRFARDAYMLSAVLASRPHVHLIAGRTSDSGDPLAPSRLWLACEDARLVERIERFFPSDRDDVPPPARLTRLRPRDAADLPVPPLPTRLTGESMRVTEFRDYLACPYRYYLRHVLRLTSLDDRREELDGGSFGELTHNVLAALGRSELANSTSAPRIAALLLDELTRRVRDHLGEAPPTAVRIQIEQLRRRLDGFAQWQAGWAAQGWRIAHVETGCDRFNPAPFTVDGKPVLLRGRIDRVDIHPQHGVMIFDYKTGDTVDGPDKTHRRTKLNEWVDLQLPLYRHLAHHLKIIDNPADARLRLGYILLPKDIAKITAAPAEWDAQDLADADETARHVVREIRAGQFGMASRPIDGFDEFDAICQVGRLAELIGETRGEEGES